MLYNVSRNKKVDGWHGDRSRDAAPARCMFTLQSAADTWLQHCSSGPLDLVSQADSVGAVK